MMGTVAKMEQRSVYTSLMAALSSRGASKGRNTYPPHTKKGNRRAAVHRDTPAFRASLFPQQHAPGNGHR